MAMKITPCRVKTECSPQFTSFFRAILYSNKIPFGAKCLAFTIMDLPGKTKPKNAKLARKLGSTSSQVSVWRKQLKRHGVLS